MKRLKASGGVFPVVRPWIRQVLYAPMYRRGYNILSVLVSLDKLVTHFKRPSYWQVVFLHFARPALLVPKAWSRALQKVRVTLSVPCDPELAQRHRTLASCVGGYDRGANDARRLLE